MSKVYFIDVVHPVLEERISQTLSFTCIDATEWSREKCMEQATDAIGLVVRSRFPIDADFLQHFPHLEFILRSGSGLENIDQAYCSQRNIQLFNSPEGNRNAVAEQALGMLLSMMNHLHTANSDIRNGIWDRFGNTGEELDGKTVGIIGYGNNGMAFAQKLRGFDVKVVAYDKYKTGFGDDFVMEATLHALLGQCDVLSFHIPQNKETIYFANDELFDALQKPIYLLNLSRGKIVETNALIKALENGKVKAAALDVNEFESSSFEDFFSRELPESLNYLLHNKRVLLTPHVGGWTTESYFKLSNVLADKIIAHYQQQ